MDHESTGQRHVLPLASSLYQANTKTPGSGKAMSESSVKTLPRESRVRHVEP